MTKFEKDEEKIYTCAYSIWVIKYNTTKVGDRSLEYDTLIVADGTGNGTPEYLVSKLLEDQYNIPFEKRVINHESDRVIENHRIEKIYQLNQVRNNREETKKLDEVIKKSNFVIFATFLRRKNTLFFFDTNAQEAFKYLKEEAYIS